MAKTLLVLSSLLLNEMEILGQHFKVIRLNKEGDPERAIRENCDDIVGIVSSHTTPVHRSLIDVLPNLEIIANFAVGVDNVDLDCAKERGVKVTNTPDVLSDETAVTGLSLMLAVTRRVVEADMFVRVGKWPTTRFPLGTSLSKKTIGIVGLGRIGQSVAKKAEAFDMDVIYYGRGKKDDQPYEFVPDLKRLAERSDVLMLCCYGGPETKNIITYDILESLGKKGFLINISRGSVVNEDDLLQALANKKIAGAGLDVYANEPHVPEGLLKMDNVVLLPHVGSATFETRTKMGQLVAGNILAHFNGDKLLSEYEV
jgi:hydroxypyruvate reductase